MKVNAVKCDYCNTIVDIDDAHGIVPVEDMFNRLESFPVSFKPETQNVHFCQECYRVNVIIPADNKSNRKKDEEGYKTMLKEHSYVFKAEVVRRARLKKK